MHRFYRLGFGVAAAIIVSAFNSFGQCAGKFDNPLKIEDLISSNGKNGDCLKFNFSEIAKNLVGASEFTLFSPKGNSSHLKLAIYVVGKPDLLNDKLPRSIENTLQADPGDAHGVLQITCSGAKTPRIAWGPTRFYFSNAFDKDGTMLEAPVMRFGGYGQDDKNAVRIESENYAAETGGSSVFPITEYISCMDLDNRNEAVKFENVRGPDRFIYPSLSVLGNVKDSETGEEYDAKNLPVGRDLTMCLAINVHPAGDEFYQLWETDYGTGGGYKVLHDWAVEGNEEFKKRHEEYKDRLKVPLDFVKPGKANVVCLENIKKDKPGHFSLSIKLYPNEVDSNAIMFEAVNK